MFRPVALAAAALLTVACVQPAEIEEEETAETTSEALISCGWLAGGDCRDVPRGGNWRSPHFWADVYLNKFAAQRKAFNENIEPATYPPLAKSRTVVLVTGVTIRAAWFEGIQKRLERDGFKTVMYEPPNLLTGDLFQASKELGDFVEKVQAENGGEKVDILAECTGGLIARHYIQALGGEDHVARMVTFVSPQNGIAAVPLVAWFTGWPALYDLSPGSRFLRTVNSASLPKNVPFTSIYTCTDEYIQPYKTSIIKGATNINICGEGFVGHFQTMYDVKYYKMMHDALMRE